MGAGRPTKNNLQLGACQRLGDTPVRSKTEAQRVIGIRRAVHIEDIRVREDILVSVARLVQGDDALACPDQL